MWHWIIAAIAIVLIAWMVWAIVKMPTNWLDDIEDDDD